MNDLLRTPIAAKPQGVLPPRARRAVQHACARYSPRHPVFSLLSTPSLRPFMNSASQGLGFRRLSWHTNPYRAIPGVVPERKLQRSPVHRMPLGCIVGAINVAVDVRSVIRHQRVEGQFVVLKPHNIDLCWPLTTQLPVLFDLFADYLDRLMGAGYLSLLVAPRILTTTTAAKIANRTATTSNSTSVKP